MILEFLRLSNYLANDFRFSYLRTKDNLKIDLVIERPGRPLALIEIKSSESIVAKDLRHLISVQSEFPNADFFCLCQEEHSRTVNGVQVMNWNRGIQSILF